MHPRRDANLKKKDNRAGNLYKISGQVVWFIVQWKMKNEEEPVGHLISGTTQNNDTKEARIFGCNFEISKP